MILGGFFTITLACVVRVRVNVATSATGVRGDFVESSNDSR